ncbi:MAG: septum formation initiator family protein [Candidatus Avispirillum sp.]
MANADVRITSAQDNPLCARLQTKFSGRGIAAGDLTRTATVDRSLFNSKGAQKVQRVADPFEDTARFVSADARHMAAKTARFEAVRTTQTSSAREKAAHTAESARTAQSAQASAQAARRRAAAGEVTTPFASGAYAAAYARAADIRRMAYDGSMAKAAQAREAQRKNAGTSAPFPLTPAWFKYVFSNLKSGAHDEVKVDNPPVSKGIIIAIVLFAVVVMMIIFSFSQISAFKREISDLEAQRSELCEEIEKLSLDVDLKNNVREIERAATEDIGMVKSNQVQSKYISLSDGERIEVITNTSDSGEKDYGVFSTVMSVFDRNWDNLMDYIG